MENKESLIQMENLKVAYPMGTEALKSVSISVNKGEFLIVV